MENTIQKKEKIRSSNIELLRILAMFLIVACHYGGHGIVISKKAFDIKKLFVLLISSWGGLGVNIFTLITGYFLCEQAGFKWKRIFKFVSQVFLFSVFISTFLALTGNVKISLDFIEKAFMPLTFRVWWFATAYFVLILLAPFLNFAIGAMDQKSHFKLIAIATVLWSVVPTITIFVLHNPQAMERNDFIWLVYLYVVAAYVKKYPTKQTENLKLNIWISAIMLVIICMSFAFFGYVGQKINFFNYRVTGFANKEVLTCLILSISLFCMFKNLKIKDSKIINNIAAAMFGVYMLHEHSHEQKIILWEKIFKCSYYYENGNLILHAIITILLTFVICTLISYLYNLIIAKITDKWIDTIIYKIDERIAKKEIVE